MILFLLGLHGRSLLNIHPQSSGSARCLAVLLLGRAGIAAV
jgi:hypothetical protein